ncbi:hypothetical protein DUZ24_09115 [Escherichia coli]|nr:hypothetical protein [Escherichia coli]
MKTAHIYSPGYALLAGLLLTASTGAQAVDNNLHFYGNLLSKSCTLVVDGANLNNTTGATFALTNGNNDINFRAWIQAKSGRDVTIGDFTASLTATFEYI